MTSFAIKSDEIAGVLTSVETPVSALMTNFQNLSTAAVAVFDNDGMTDTVSSALNTLFEDQSGRITAIGNRINASMSGVYFATLEYNHGHEDMVAQTQAAAVSAAQNGDFSYFTAKAQEYGIDQGGAS